MKLTTRQSFLFFLVSSILYLRYTSWPISVAEHTCLYLGSCDNEDRGGRPTARQTLSLVVP